jgi:hypothetical protein
MPDQLLLNPAVVHKGKHPLYDVSVRITDVRPGKFDAQSGLRAYPIGNLSPGLASLTAIRIPQDGKDLMFNIFFVARNGTWTQFLRMPWIGDGWGKASKIVRDRDGAVVLREVSDNFPRNEKGEIDWGEAGAQDRSK